jgi:heptosyltransferase-2
VGLARLIGELRGRRFDAAVILHHSRMLSFAAMAAGIPERQGYGYGTQRICLNRGPFLPGSTIRLHQFQRASAWLVAAGIPIADAEPRLAVSEAARSAVRARLGVACPFVALGIGGSEVWKQWGAARFTALARLLLDAGWGRLVLVGGAGEAPLAEAIVAGLAERGRMAVPALGWHLTETVALLADAAFLIGNNTATMNMAAAVGVRSYGLFGTAPPFGHSSQIVPIVSDGPDDGVARLGLEAVLAAVVADRGGLGRG